MSFVTDAGRRLLGAADTIIPFSPTSYEQAWSDRLRPKGLPPATMESAMGLPAAYACTTVISEDIAKVPLQIFEQTGDSRKEAHNHPIYDLLHDQPNDEQTALEFREWMVAIAVNRGRAVAEIKSGKRGPVDQLVPLHPDRISWETLRDGTRRVRFNDPIKGTRTIPRSELFVLGGRGNVGVIKAMARTFGIMLSMQDAQADLYARGLRSPGYLKHPKQLSDPARADLRAALDEYIGGGERAGRPMLLEDGTEWKTIALSMEDAQFLQSLQDGYNQVCMAYRVPQHKIQMLLRATNNNIEQQTVDYTTDSLVGWAVRLEQAIRRDLIVAKGRYFAKHNLDGLLRGDLKTRYEAYQIAIITGWMTRAEAREKEDWDPIPGLDEPLQMLNMGSGGRDSGQPSTTVPRPSSAATVSYLRTLVRDGAARVVRGEVNELTKLAKKTSGSGDAWDAGVREFFDAHAETVERVLRITAETAQDYCAEREAAVVTSGPDLLKDDMDFMEAVSALSRRAHQEADILQLPAGDTEPEDIAA